jgi:dTDP-4-dehydrorhamnose 3,5-epimerase
MLYVPEGFAHGYLTLTDCTEVLYQVSQFYTPGAEQGIRWNDSTFQIVWPEMENLEISRKDQSWPDWSD